MFNKFRVWSIRDKEYEAAVVMDGNGQLFQFDRVYGTRLQPLYPRTHMVEYCTGLPAAKSYRGNTEADLLIYHNDLTKLAMPDGTDRIFTVQIKTVERNVISHPTFDDTTAHVSITGVVFSWNGFDLFPCLSDGRPDTARMEIIGTIHDLRGTT